MIGHSHEQNAVDSIGFFGNGGIFQKHLASIKRLITSRPTLKQYRLQRRQKNYFSTVRPHHLPSKHPVTPCPSASTDCILEQLRSRGLIRNTPTTYYRRPKQIQPSIETYPQDAGASQLPQKNGYGQVPRGRGHYKPDCWSDDGESDQAPPINYDEYSDERISDVPNTDKRRKRMAIQRNRRGDGDSSYPCLWQEDWQG